MTQKTRILRELTLYFMEKGKIMTNREYKAQKDKPLKSSNIIRVLGSWGRIERMIQKNFPVEYDLIKNPKVEEKKEPVKAPVVEKKEEPKQEPKKPVVTPEIKGSKK